MEERYNILAAPQYNNIHLVALVLRVGVWSLRRAAILQGQSRANESVNMRGGGGSIIVLFTAEKKFQMFIFYIFS